MPADQFVHLHCHSEYSLLDGAARIKEMVKVAKELGMPAIALTDHGNMYGTVQFVNAAKEAGIKPIIGCELYVAPRTRFDKETKEDRSPYHLTALVKNAKGYTNLMNLVSLASIDGFYSRPRVDHELLEKYHEGIVFLSGCPKGEIPFLMRNGNPEKAREVAKWSKDLFGDDFYVELQDLSLPGLESHVPNMIQIAKEFALKVVATNDTHYVKKNDAYAQDVLLSIQTGAFLDDKKRMKLQSSEFYLKSCAEMSALFTSAPAAISNSLEIADKCNFELEMGKLHLPDYQVPKGETPDTFLEKLAWDGVKKKYGSLLPPEIIDRVKYELYVIEKMGYAAYFLIVQDFINHAKSKGIPVGPGRGSAAGSIVSYALGITNIDPLKYGLIFERFLNDERVSMPDIDVDFCIERRGEVIEYVAAKYGQDHVAQIVTFGTMAARGALRDVGRVLQIPLPEVDKIAKLVPFGPGVTLESALQNVKEFKALYDQDQRIKHLIDTAKSLEGLSRHASVHAAGVVISENPLTNYAPLQKLDKSVIVTQFPMGDLEKIGLLKMDFLGLRNLTMIAHALEIIKKKQGVELDLDNIPLDDHKTYAILCGGETMGIFQLESRGMKTLIKDLQPTHFEEIIALLALYRPGPLESGMVVDYVNRKHKRVPVKYTLPQLEPILRETYGVILYQEQVMKIASEVGGFTLGQADLLRRAMGKKKAKEMQQQKKFFVDGAVKKGISQHKATELFDLCAKFAGYGFNKSHSAAYGIISYQTAYLKANYPKEFMAALLTSISSNADKVTGYVSECRHMGIKILPPDVNESERNFTVTDEGIRFGFSGIRNVGEAAIDSIIECQKNSEPFQSLTDFCERVDSRTVNKKVIESLIKAGAFDSFGQGRAYQLAVLGKIMNRVATVQKERANGQAALFGSQPTVRTEDLAVEIEEFGPEQLLKMEKEMIGLYISSHPLHYVSESLEAQVTTKIVDIAEMSEGEPVRIGGLLSESRRLTTKKGDMMMVARIEDLSGSIGLVVFPKTFKKAESMLNNDQIIVVKGKVNRDMRSEEFNVVAEEVFPMADIEKKRSLHVELVGVSDPGVLGKMREIFMMYNGVDPVYLKMDGQSIDLNGSIKVDINPDLVMQLEKLLGTGSVNVEYRAVVKEEKNNVQSPIQV